MAESVVTSKHTDFSRGSIKRIHMINFMTHRDTLYEPSSRVNLVLGANGSGKSSIVCAFCIGLGGEAKHMVRVSNLKGFVTSGAKEGSVETTLCAGPGLPDIIVKRCIRCEDNKSEWFLQGQRVPSEQVQEVLRGLSIDMSNMTQFLPQEKITDFTKLDASTLLEHVEMALGRGLREEHLGIITTGRNMGERGHVLHAKKKELEDTERKMVALSPEVASFEKVSKLNALGELLKIRHGYATAKDLEAEAKKLEEEADGKAREKELDELTLKHTALQKPLLEAREEESSCKASFTAASKALKSAQDVQEDVYTHKLKVGKHMTDMLTQEGELTAFRSGRDDLMKNVSNAKRKYEASAKHLKELESKGAPSAEVAANLRLRANEAGKAKAEADVERNTAEQALKGPQSALSRVKTDLARAQGVRSQRLDAVCDKFRRMKGLLQVAEWSHGAGKASFKMPVYGPVAAEMEANGASKAQRGILENMITGFVLQGFVVGCEEDRITLQAFMQQNGYRNSIMVVDPKLAQTEIDNFLSLRNREMGPAAVAALAEKLKLSATAGSGTKTIIWGDSLISAPLPVRAALYRDGNMWRFLLGEVDDLCARAADAGGAGVLRGGYTLCGLDGTIRAMFSRTGEVYNQRSGYFGDLSPFFLHVEEDKDAIKRLQEVHDGMVGKVGLLEKAVKEANAAATAKAAAQREAQDKASTAETMRSAIDKARRGVANDKKHFEEVESSLLSEESAKASAEGGVKKLRALQSHSMEDIAAVLEYMKATNKAQAEHAVACARLAHASALYKEITANVTRLKNRIEMLSKSEADKKKKVEALFARASEAMDAYQKRKDSCTTAQQEALNGLPSTAGAVLAHQADVDTQLTTLKAQVDMNVMKKYESLQAGSESLKLQVTTLETALTKNESELEKRKVDFMHEIGAKAKGLHARFKANMLSISCHGEVNFVTSEDPEKWGLQVKVAFRASERGPDGMGSGRVLGEMHSGGEKAIATMLLLMAMQELTSLPFRIVDEINQGMDSNNEGAVMRVLAALYDNIGTAAGAPARFLPDGKQLFIITPKLLPALSHAPSMRSSIVFNGPEVAGPQASHALYLSFSDLAQFVDGDYEVMQDVFEGLRKESSKRARATLFETPVPSAGAVGEADAEAEAGAGSKRKRIAKAEADMAALKAEEEDGEYGAGTGRKRGRIVDEDDEL